MDAEKVTDVKMHVCNGCEQQLNAAGNTIRRHATLVLHAIEIGRSNPSDEVRQEQRALVSASFKEAQAAWNAYSDHLAEHGIPISDKS
jgi:hypothetical protein